MTYNRILVIIIMAIGLIVTVPGIIGNDKEEQEKLLQARETIVNLRAQLASSKNEAQKHQSDAWRYQNDLTKVKDRVSSMESELGTLRTLKPDLIRITDENEELRANLRKSKVLLSKAEKQAEDEAVLNRALDEKYTYLLV
eukprot:TRINITY_DN10354_c0_g1_i1.p1 TRINITY_DN10354_c0_g1~~TRINITY_DN10354_c0_g1_i1.p1  ORF type:complete len:141 (+),score=24.92 TRINITY_DN10354_c0_g1_i1:172-594(+)